MPITRIGINGFGSIGQQIFKILSENYPQLQVVALGITNPIKADIKTALQQGTTYGIFGHTMEIQSNGLIVDNHNIAIIPQLDSQHINRWAEYDIDLIIDTTGHCQRRSDAVKYFQTGAKKFIIAQPAGWADATIVYGLNHHIYNPDQHQLISTSSYITIALALISRVLDEHFGLMEGFATVVHATGHITSPQVTTDDITLTSTSLARELNRILPGMGHRLTTAVLRVPTSHVSMLDFMTRLKQPVTAKQINKIFHQAAAGPLAGSLAISDELLDVADYIGNRQSAVIDTLSTTTAGQLVRLAVRYHNDWSYAWRVADTVAYITQQEFSRWTINELLPAITDTQLTAIPQ